MNIKILSIGKTDDKSLIALIDGYIKRLKHYIKLEFRVIPDIKNRKNIQISQQKVLEGELIIKNLQTSDVVVLLDEKGQDYSSIDFSKYISKKMLAGTKQLVFVIGGPYGFSESVYKRANHKISLSKMTFSHQMVRLFVVEQIYRAFTILKNEPYHHE